MVSKNLVVEQLRFVVQTKGSRENKDKDFGLSWQALCKLRLPFLWQAPRVSLREMHGVWAGTLVGANSEKKEDV